MSILVGWIEAGLSGSVVGAAGIGKSNLLGFLCHRPDALRQYLAPDAPATALISVDLNNLPADDTATLYRVILRSFYESSKQFDAPLQEIITSLYQENRTARDPFLPHSALRELILAFQEQQIQVALILDRFDRFYQDVAPEMTYTLRGLRDSFKDTVCYIAGMRQEVGYLSDPAALGELYELLDTNICWVQPMCEADAREMIAGQSSLGPAPSEDDICQFLALSGGHPGLLKAIYHWWRTNPGRPDRDWRDLLLETPSIQHRLQNIWRSLTLSEQQVMGAVHESQVKTNLPAYARQKDRQEKELDSQQRKTTDLLAKKGLIVPQDDGHRIGASILDAYVGQMTSFSPGFLWQEQATGILYQGNKTLDNLSPLEGGLLDFLIRHPRTRHTHTDIIEAVWPDDMNKEGVSTEALYQVVRGLRRKIEPEPSQPHYIINWRGSPEGGYQCFPEGRPG
jgi:DNA-binding winged helix-turn-helix (wHTH) protein